ncbi:LPXTG cell wall anchor domain-containing protein [Methylorubrum thiocyanatum]
MVGWILGKLKWLTVLCAVGGPIVALACWQDGNRRRDVMAMGIQTEATVDSATRVKRRRGGTSYKLDLSWTDGGGVRRKVEEVSISHALAAQVIVDDKLAVERLPIKYIAGEAGSPKFDENVVILADTAHQEQTDQELVYVGSAAGFLGLIGAALFFLPRRRRREAVAA